MYKAVTIFVRNSKKRRFLLYEKCGGHYSPAADSQIRQGVVDDSDDLKVIIDSVLKIPDGAKVKFEIPEDLNHEEYSQLTGVEQLFVREQLGRSP